MLKKLLILSIFSITSHAIDASKIETVMHSKIHQVLKILQNPSYSLKQKEKKSIAIMDPVFDYQTMSMISLGSQWKKLNTTQKRQFTKAFKDKMKRSYVDKLKLYNNQKVIFKPLKKVSSTRMSLESIVQGKSENYKVKYLFYKNKKTSQWYIYDVHLAGVSIIQTYRKQFSSFLKTKSFQQLLHSL